MTSIELSAVITYCSIDSNIVEHCIKSVLDICDEVILVYCDCLFDGTIELDDTISQLRSRYESITFICVKWRPNINFAIFEGQPNFFWHCMMRYTGYTKSRGKYILSLDSDEVMDPLFKDYVSDKVYEAYTMTRFEAYWYFREPVFLARQTEPGCSLIKREIALDRNKTFSIMDRGGCFINIEDEKCAALRYLYLNKPLCHHFSWVRSRENLYKKVRTWGHSTAYDWNKILDKELSSPFSLVDPIHGYQYDIVEDKFGIGPQTYETKECYKHGIHFVIPKGITEEQLNNIYDSIKGKNLTEIKIVPIKSHV